jgi:hypothetical protein
MSRGVRSLVAAGIVGVSYWAWQRYARDQLEAQANTIQQPPPLDPVSGTDSTGFRLALLDGAFNLIEAVADGDQGRARNTSTGILGNIFGETGLGDALDTSARDVLGNLGLPVDVPSSGPLPQNPSGNGSTEPLLSLIRSVEAPRGYDDYFRGVSAPPPRRLTTMTVGEVLAWQESIDSTSPSEAAGAYQIMEDTLRDLVRRGVVSTSERFDRATQDRLALALMERRGLSQYRAGRISQEQFAQRLSMEWASLPAITRDRSGRPATGQSYYAGDGLNKSLVSQQQFLNAVRVI